jgi:hypothetical protein
VHWVKKSWFLEHHEISPWIERSLRFEVEFRQIHDFDSSPFESGRSVAVKRPPRQSCRLATMRMMDGSDLLQPLTHRPESASFDSVRHHGPAMPSSRKNMFSGH